MSVVKIAIATVRPWNILQYRRWKPPVRFKKYLICSKGQLTPEGLRKLNPRYIFFPHWSWIIPPEIYENFECVVFHMTDLPYGRGGSPLQNLIIRGKYKTKISAIRVVKELDAGPVYMKRPLNLSRGSAQELYRKASRLTFRMIGEILRKSPRSKPQAGRAVVFRRRKPEESRIPEDLDARGFYDFIRMLDAEGYPRAFIECGRFRLEFRDAALRNDSVEARVIIKRS